MISKINYIFNNDDIFHIYVFVSAGSIYENKNLHGASHLLEHMLFKNKGKASNNLSKSLTSTGSISNAVTYKDVTFYYIKSHASTYEECIDYMHQIISKANFTDEDLNIERKVVLEEFYQYSDKTGDANMEKIALNTILNDKNPYLKNVIGTENVIKNIKASDLKKYYKTRYDKSIIVINCPKTLYKNIDKRIKSLFKPNLEVDLNDSNLENSTKLFNNEAKIIVINENYKQNITRLTYYTGKPTNMKDDLVLNFITYCLTGSGLFSLMYYELRVKLGLIYSVSSFYEAFRYTGLLYIGFASSNNKIEYILTLCLKLLLGLKKNGLKPKLFKYYKTSFINSLKYKLANTNFVTEWYGFNVFYGNNVSIKDYIKIAQSITNDDIKNICSKYIDFKKQGILCVGNYDEPKIITKKIDKLLDYFSSQ